MAAPLPANCLGLWLAMRPLYLQAEEELLVDSVMPLAVNPLLVALPSALGSYHAHSLGLCSRLR